MHITTSEDETKKIASDMVKTLMSPTCIALKGELGAGKTVFVKGIANGLGIKDIIQSPTFIILRPYEGRMKLYHIDLFRINSIEEVIPIEEYLLKDGITAIEWAEHAEGLLPEERIDILIEIIDRKKRRITINDNRN